MSSTWDVPAAMSYLLNELCGDRTNTIFRSAVRTRLVNISICTFKFDASCYRLSAQWYVECEGCFIPKPSSRLGLYTVARALQWLDTSFRIPFSGARYITIALPAHGNRMWIVLKKTPYCSADVLVFVSSFIPANDEPIEVLRVGLCISSGAVSMKDTQNVSIFV